MQQTCKCGCGEIVNPGRLYIWGHNRRGKKASEETKQKMSFDRTGSKNAMYGKPQSEKCKEINRKRMIGNHINNGRKSPYLTALNKSRTGISISNIQKEKQRQSILKYWNSNEGKKQKLALSNINRKWAKNYPEKKIMAAKNGHRKCPKISSLERKVEIVLQQLNLDYVPQYEYELGFMDFLIKPNGALFINGDYWHNYPNGTEKDKRQLAFLENHGFDTLIIWERELAEFDKLQDKLLDFHLR